MERLIIVILVCLLVFATIIDIGATVTAKVQLNNARSLSVQIQQQQNKINAFIAQLQRCPTLEDVDTVLEVNGIQRVK
jgi:hypothetical protein